MRSVSCFTCVKIGPDRFDKGSRTGIAAQHSRRIPNIRPKIGRSRIQFTRNRAEGANRRFSPERVPGTVFIAREKVQRPYAACW